VAVGWAEAVKVMASVAVDGYVLKASMMLDMVAPLKMLDIVVSMCSGCICRIVELKMKVNLLQCVMYIVMFAMRLYYDAR
jgi:hypothetical protein